MIIGIDPGVSGAIAILDYDGDILDVVDMPIIKPGKRTRVNSSELARLISEHSSRRRVSAVVEKVGAMPGQGTASMFSFGHSAGVIDGVLAALHIPVEYVTPQSWKKHYTLVGKDKEAGRAKAIQLYPTASLSRKKDVGRADALLIAKYGLNLQQVKREAA